MDKYYYSDNTISSKMSFKKTLHRVDGPAIECENGSKWWYFNGVLHRENGPAIEWSNGDKTWFKHGLIHRDNEPAVELADGRVQYWIDGKYFKPLETKPTVAVVTRRDFFNSIWLFVYQMFVKLFGKLQPVKA